jgi:hypothetical protein
MQLHSNIACFRKEGREPLALIWERTKEYVGNCPNNLLKGWLILYLFYHALNSMSKSILDTAADGISMGKEIDIATKSRYVMSLISWYSLRGEPPTKPPHIGR